MDNLINFKTEQNLYYNLKNGRRYYLLDDEVTNSTNAQDGERMVLYTDESQTRLFVRSYDEFQNKFMEA